MRKRAYFHILLIIVLLFSAIPAQAATDRRSLMEFCELYAMRMSQHASDELYVYGGSSVYSELESTSEYYVSTTGASVHIDKETFGISSATFELITIRDDEYEERINECTAVIAALEFTQTDDDLADLRVSSQLFPDALSTWNQSKNIVYSILGKIDADNESFWQKFTSGQNIPVYTGNYAYSMEFHTFDDGFVAVYLFAEAQ